MKLIILIIKIKMSPSVSNRSVGVWVALLDPAAQLYHVAHGLLKYYVLAVVV